MRYVIGMDIGTGSVKAVGFSMEGEHLESSQVFYSYHAPHPGYHEQDAEEIWNSFQLSIKELITKMGVAPLVVGISSAMHSLVPVDHQGLPLGPLLTWADNRSAEQAERLKNSPIGMQLYQATGTPIHAMSPLCKIIWIREQEPALFNQASRFISIKEFIWYKLFQEFKVDYSIASATGLFNIHQYSWHRESLDTAGISERQLSEPVPTDYIRYYDPYKDHAVSDFIKESIPFVIGASDGCMANLGSLAFKEGDAAITIGTSGALRVASSKPIADASSMIFSYILDKQTFICGGAINNGGIALQWWLKNNVSPQPSDNDYDDFFRQIEDIPAGSEGLIFLPYLMGERAPVWDSKSCGSFFGLRLEHTRRHFSKALLEGICYSLKDVLQSMENNGLKVGKIHLSGGIVKSPVWTQLLSDIIGKPLLIVSEEDASAAGAAFMACSAIGEWSESPLVAAKEEQIVYPQLKNTGIYSKNFSIFKQLYADLKGSMHTLYDLNR